MRASRLWYLLGIAAFLALIAVVPAYGSDDSGGMSAREAELLADFLILAVKPEGDERDYKLVEIGDTKINAGLLGVVINTLPLDFLGLGPTERDYDEAAEIAQCRAACRANSECRDFTYARPTSSQPVGVCRLKRVVKFGTMSPVVEGHEQSERPSREPTQNDGRLVIDGNDKSGRVTLVGDDVRATPLTVRFPSPASSVTIYIRAANFTEGRSFAAVEAQDARGKRLAQNGAWIEAGKFNVNRGVTVATENDAIAMVKVTSRDGATLIIDGIQFARLGVTPIYVPEKPKPETKPETKPEPPRETVPPAPRIGPAVAIFFPMPPRVTPTAPPTDITPPPEALETPVTQPTVEQPPAPAIETPPATDIAATPAPARKRGLPLWLALGAIAAMLAGAGLYHRNHRARMLKRLSTRLVSDGIADRTITIDLADDANHSLRFVVRAAANINAPATRIELTPRGATA